MSVASKEVKQQHQQQHHQQHFLCEPDAKAHEKHHTIIQLAKRLKGTHLHYIQIIENDNMNND